MFIRSSQARVLADEAFANRLAASLRRQFALQTARLSEVELKRSVRAAIIRARSYGLTWESSIAVFAALGVVAGAGFEQDPVVRSILTDKGFSEQERVALLIERF